MKKNILIISYGYPPINDAGAQRPYAIAKYLDKDKFNVTVLTCLNPSASLGVNENFDPALENVNVIRIKSYIGGNTSNSFSTKVDKKGLKSKIKSFIFVLVQKMMFPDKGMFWYPNVKKYLKNNKDLIDNCDFVIYLTSSGIDESGKVLLSDGHLAETDTYFARSRFSDCPTLISPFTVDNLRN
jgi:hypothetical protein